MADALMEALRGRDLLTRIAQQIEARRDELRPMMGEYERLLSASQALEQEAGGVAARPSTRPPSSRQPDERSRPVRPRVRSARNAPARRGSAADPLARAGSDAPRRAKDASPRAARGAAQQAILAALEHGSHTAGELAMVTAMSGPNIRENLRRLLGPGTVTRTKRADGKAAYALARSVR